MPQLFGVRWRLAGAFFLIVMAIVSLTGIYLLSWTESYYLSTITQDLRKESQFIARLYRENNGARFPDRFSSIVQQMGDELEHRITIIASDGKVILDSSQDPREMENHADRSEIVAASQTGFGTAVRYSATLKTDMLYAASRIGTPDNPIGVARISEPLSDLHRLTSVIRRTFLLTAVLALIFAAVLSVKLAESITSPIERIAAAARKIAAGDLNTRVSTPEKPTEETGALAVTFNNMASNLQDMINQLEEQKSRMQTIFDRTDDGLILVDPNHRIQMINPAACRMLSVSGEQALNKTIIEGTLNHDLASLLDRVSRTSEPAALEIAQAIREETVMQAYVAPLEAPQGPPGALVVLHDVTAARQLDAVRRDFAANVSHELRTPLASIKAMAETILLRHKTDPSAAAQFAQSIVEEADRMALLAEDLLDLARIESGRRALRSESIKLGNLVDSVVERLRPAALRKSIDIVSKIPEDKLVKADPDALDQIIANLVDNALKYTGEGGSVTIEVDRVDSFESISVTDTGIGIPDEALPRIFERFYRVDKARSRESGGTGLGLSIVKHLTESMGGKVTVTSELDRGTTFTVTIPAA